MSTIYGTQLQPFEEIQSPSPTETHDNPYETALATRSSSLPHRRGSGPPSPVNTVNTLHRQLSGDPESPPPAWKRRPTVSNRQRSSPSENNQRSPVSVKSDQGPGTQRSPSQSSIKSRDSLNSPNGIARRPPSGLMMTTAVTAAPSPKPALPLPNGMFLHESPNGSSTDLTNADLALPNPAFRRRRNGSSSNRSSIASNQDLSSLTSEELWSMGQPEDDTPDMSNPMRQAAERPLDTVRRETRRFETRPQSYVHVGLPGDVIWPTAPPVEEILPNNLRSKSFTNVATLGMSGRRMSRRAKSRQSSIDVSPINTKDVDGMHMHNVSQPASPGVNGMLSSAHSSTTSLTSQAIPPNKSLSSLSGRPPSTYYSRDFLSSLAPREGGYAIAAQMGGGLGAVGTMTAEEKRRSISNFDDIRTRTVGSRAPPSKSAGMGRWSLDGGENFGRPYATPSAATTSSNLSAPPINSAEPSPPAEEYQSTLPAGAAPSMSSGPSLPVSTTPPNPSPLAQQTSAEQVIPPSTSAPIRPAPPPIPASSAPIAPSLVSKKSRKELAKENKAAEKLEVQKVARQRAEAHRAETLRKEAEREEIKRKEKEEKAKKKADKKANKKGRGIFGRSTNPSSTTGSGSSAPQLQSRPPIPPAAPIPVNTQQFAGPTTTAPQQPSSNNIPVASSPTIPAPEKTLTADPAPLAQPSSSTGTPFPKPKQSSHSDYQVPVKDTIEPSRQTHRSMPLTSAIPTPAANRSQTPTRPPIEGKRSLFGTIKKRFSYIGGSSESKVHQTKDTPPPVPPIPGSPVVAQKPQQQQSKPRIPAETPLPTSQASTDNPLPPRRDSLVAPTSAKIGSPASISSPTVGGVSSTPTKSIAQEPATPVSNLVLGKSVSRESGSSPLSINRKRNSLHGPRPMPSSTTAGQSRPSSITTHESSSLEPTGLQQTISTLSSSGNHNGENHSGSGSGPESSMLGPVTPSTTGDSNSFFQNNITPITSPEEDVTSSEDERITGRASSGDSGKTVHAHNVPNGQPILI
ncbi:uncharacterized protein I206_104564 [Kwoniella pini CBS 10737]|uniref:Uncharacterized protein n=1 Tax=Kwoniella pini CBS 10737 TaxID=1296096 RepID=A0A1B9I7A8_9TREE|nr:uncharacterized protein I206_02098 [Kwoniella pini CBS 10737]OCF51384.1 hypothetical protein I206_02098 [Kwoniella pini CBS 10737]